MLRIIRATLFTAVVISALSVPRPARAQGVGNCLIFGAWVAEQGGTVYFVNPSLTPPWAIIGFELYGQGMSMFCLP